MSRPNALLAGVVVSAVVIGIAVVSVVYARDKRASTDVVSTSAQNLAAVTEQRFTPRTQSTGSVRLMPGARIEVGARVSGVVRELAVTQGSRVTRGQVIARLDAGEARARLAQANARITELEANARQAAEDLSRLETLARANGATQQEVIAARSTLAAVQARLDATRSDRDLAQIQLDYTTVRAPISGVVASVTTHEGETVAASFSAPTFVTLIDPSQLECVALVDETDIGHITPGDSAEFTVDAYPGRAFRGVVIRLAPDATIVSGVVDYEVTLRILDGVGLLKPQMTASVSIAGRPRVSLVIPSGAVRQSPTGAYVWRRRAGAVTRVAVQLGARQSDLTEIKSGLARGDTVLTSGFPEGI